MFSKRFLLSTALLCVTGFATGISHADNFRTAGEWTVTSEDAQGYCTAVQPFSNNTYVTIGERDDGAMSIAFDFQKPVFTMGQTQSAKITAGTTSRTYSSKPKSEGAIVLAVGIDDAFRNALAKSNTMELSFNGEKHTFPLENSGKSLSILKDCILALRGAPAQQVAAAPQKAEAEPTRTAAAQISETPQNVQAVQEEAPRKSSAVISTVNMSYLQEENERLKTALAQTRREYENLAADVNASAKNAEMQERIARYEKEIQGLKSQINEQAQVTQTPQEVTEEIQVLQAQLAESKNRQSKLEAELAEAKGQLTRAVPVPEVAANSQELQAMQQKTASLQAEKKAMQERLISAEATIANLQSQLGEMAKMETESLKADDSTQKIAAMTQQLNQANSEKVTLQAQLKSANESLASMEKEFSEKKAQPTAQLNANADVIARLEKELTELKNRNQTLSQNLAEARQAQVNTEEVTPQVDQQVLARLRNEVNALEEENQSLKTKVGELNRNLIENSAAMASVQEQASPENKALKENLKEARAQLDRLLDENATLSADLEKLRDSTDKQVVQGATGDWNLEQATRRYQEAQREIRRLGSLLKQQRGKCEAEKKDIEYMLFDPAIADQEQISQLNALESQLAEAKTRIRELEKQFGLAPSNIGSSPAPASPAVVQAETLQPYEPPVEAEIDSVPVGTAAALAARDPVISVSPQQPRVQVAAPAVSVTPSVQQISAGNTSDFKNLLDRAGVSYNSLNTAAGASKDSTTWKIGNGLFGTAKSVPVQGSFESMVRSYIDTAESRCGGEFAAIPVSTGSAQVGAKREAYEIACVNGQGGLSASLLFYQEDNQFISIAHEGGTAQMEQAMEARDRLDRTLRNSS